MKSSEHKRDIYGSVVLDYEKGGFDYIHGDSRDCKLSSVDLTSCNK